MTCLIVSSFFLFFKLLKMNVKKILLLASFFYEMLRDFFSFSPYRHAGTTNGEP